MLGTLIALTLQAAIPAVSASASAPLNPRANELFDRDPALHAWAVRIFDQNRDGWLTLYEAQSALEAFREIADGNTDGRVTTYEYERAKEFVVAR